MTSAINERRLASTSDALGGHFDHRKNTSGHGSPWALPECGQAADQLSTPWSLSFNVLGAAVLWHAVCTTDRRQIGLAGHR